MVDLGQLRRDGLGGILKPQLQQRMDELAIQRTKETNGEPLKYVEYIPVVVWITYLMIFLQCIER